MESLFGNAWLNRCKATENFIIRSWANTRAGEMESKWSRRGRQQLWQRQAEGEAGWREPEWRSWAERQQDEKEQRRRRVADRESERERGGEAASTQKLKPAGRQGWSICICEATAAIQRASSPCLCGKWSMGCILRLTLPHTHNNRPKAEQLS